jgi:hypothetical protein
MNQKNYLTLDNEFISYCKLNNIIDIDKFAMEVFNRGFNIIKYGETPKGFVVNKIVEKVKETPKEDFTDEIKKLREENFILNEKLKSLNKSVETYNTKKESDISSIYDE